MLNLCIYLFLKSKWSSYQNSSLFETYYKTANIEPKAIQHWRKYNELLKTLDNREESIKLLAPIEENLSVEIYSSNKYYSIIKEALFIF